MVNSQNYATRCPGQLNALLPEAAVELSTVPRGRVLTILPNRHEITVFYTTEPETNNVLLAIDCLISARPRKPLPPTVFS